MRKVLLSVKDVKQYYPVKLNSKSLFPKKGYVKAVDGISFDVYEGETFGLVGESGCGKSTTGKMIVKLLSPTAGSIEYDGQDLFQVPKNQEKALKKEIQIIFQDPYSSLDPKFTVGRIVAEPLVAHGVPKAERIKKVRQLLKDVGIREEFINRYPHEFSGGQRQRIGVARALALNPRLIVCDEPVSALDVSIQAQILNLLQDLQQEFHLTYLFISHDLSVVRYIADRVCVMFLGRICEIGDAEEVYSRPLHPYTKFLMDSVPLPDPDQRKEDKDLLTGEVPSPIAPPSGCRFHTRCPYAKEICTQEPPPQFRDMGGGHCCACHFPLR